MSDNYRILTNGAAFKVQRLVRFRFLWWMWEEWRDLVKNYPLCTSSVPILFDTLAAAKEFVEAWKKEDARDCQDWVSVQFCQASAPAVRCEACYHLEAEAERLRAKLDEQGHGILNAAHRLALEKNRADSATARVQELEAKLSQVRA